MTNEEKREEINRIMETVFGAGGIQLEDTGDCIQAVCDCNTYQIAADADPEVLHDVICQLIYIKGEIRRLGLR